MLKKAINWASRPYGNSAWNGKPAAIMRASVGTIGTAWAQYHLRQKMVFLNMFPVNQPEDDRKRLRAVRRRSEFER